MPTPIRIPSVAESITEVMIAEWLIKDGDSVQVDQNILVIETDKASMDIAAEFAGVVHISVAAGQVVAVGGTVGTIEEGGITAAFTPAPTVVSTPAADVLSKTTVESGPTAIKPGTGHPSPSAAVALEVAGLHASQVSGTGRDGRITKSDVVVAATTPKAPNPATANHANPSPVVAPATASASDEITRQKMSMLRRKLAERLVNVKNQTAMLTTFNEVDMSAAMAVRSKFKDAFKEKYGVNLGFMSFFTKAVTMALEAWPAVNAQIEGDEIIYNKSANVGIAVSTPKGLVVPVLRGANKMSFADIEKSIGEFAKKARDGKIAITDMEGGTFTITNGGVFGSLMSTPIINPPQSAILGMHNIVQRPIAVDGKVEIRPMMYIALSYDHRIIDGKESVSFLKQVKEIIEDPYRYFLGV